MNFIRFVILILAVLFTLTLIQAKVLRSSSSSSSSVSSQNKHDYIKYLLQTIGIENEYTRFLTYLRVFPPNHGTHLRQLYDGLFSFNAYVSDMGHIYEKYYTSEEILQLIEFYSSTLGKKTLAFNIEMNQQMEDLMLNKITDYIFTAADHNIHIPLPEIH
ncbi:hypothetical protein I4U23_001042 [Adineta vaga]|nr:hypothetical protein I4U23_001042 [Adineta vaga]